MSETGSATAPSEFSTTDKLKCLEREIAMRRNVYPRWIASGRFKPVQAAREIAVMEAIAADYRNKAQEHQDWFNQTHGDAGSQ
jgi:hypothetical protein